MKLVCLLIVLEIKAYLRNWGAVFWTFAYPIALLVLLSTIFGGQNVATVDVQLLNGFHNKQAQLFVASLEERTRMIDGLNVNASWVEGNENTPAQSGTLQIAFSEEFGSLNHISSIKLSTVGNLDEHSGSFISVIAETAEVFNRHLTNGEQLIITDYSGIPSPEDYNYDAYLISGLTALTVVSTAMFGFCTVLVSMRQNGSLKIYQVFPLSKIQFLLGFMLSRAIILFVFCLTFFYGANYILGTGVTLSIAELTKFSCLLFVGILAFLSAGLLMVSLVKNGATAVAIINIINLPVLFLSDLFMPVAMMPEFIRVVAEKSPVYLFVNSLRNVTDSGAQDLLGLTFFSLFIAGALCLWGSTKTFKWRNA
ncbi:ABC transporter permease [Thalassotalea fusca]